MARKRRKVPICPYCEKAAEFHETSERFYHGKDYGPLWACFDCSAWVGCHPGTRTPLGRLADATLRKAKVEAHAAFDRLWMAKWRNEGGRKGRARGLAYRWLAGQMGINPKLCHIGMFDVVDCLRVVEICTPYHGRKCA